MPRVTSGLSGPGYVLDVPATVAAFRERFGADFTVQQRLLLEPAKVQEVLRANVGCDITGSGGGPLHITRAPDGKFIFFGHKVATPIKDCADDLDLSKMFIDVLPMKGDAVLVATLTGATLMVPIKPGQTIEQFKITLAGISGHPPGQQRIIYAGKQLEDGRLLDECGIVPGVKVHLVLRLRGGMLHISSGRDGGFRMLGSRHHSGPAPSITTFIDDEGRKVRLEIPSADLDDLQIRLAAAFDTE